MILFKDIIKVIYSENSHNLFLIISKKYTASIESFKRQEVNLFMLDMFKRNKLDTKFFEKQFGLFLG